MVVKILDAGVTLTQESEDSPRNVADQLKASVAELLDDNSPPSCNRLQSLVMILGESAGYWMDDLTRRVREQEEAIARLGRDASASISEGRREALLSGIPKTPYARLSAVPLPEFEGELRSSLTHLAEMADVLSRSKPPAARHLDGLVSTIDAALALAKPDELALLAECHDLFASALGRVILMDENVEAGTNQ